MKNMFSKITANIKLPEANNFSAIQATHQFNGLNIIGRSEKFDVSEQEVSQPPKSLEVIVDREAIAVKSLQSSLSTQSGLVDCKFSENYLLFSNGLKFGWSEILYACETEQHTCGYIFKDENAYSMILVNFEATPEFFKTLQAIRVKQQK